MGAPAGDEATALCSVVLEARNGTGGKAIMTQSASVTVKTLADIIEMKRIYSVIDNALGKTYPACLLVTSGARGEGKTTVAAGIAAVAATHSTKQVLAVDLNWFKPALHEWFGLDPVFDVGTFRNNGLIKDIAQTTNIANLDILTASPPREGMTESAGSEYMLGTEIVTRARAEYDFVVVDASSIFPTNRHMMDPVTLSKAADGVVLVVLMNVTPRQQVKRARMFLKTAGANVLGVVVNQWKNPMAR